jgi:Zn-finger in ubiquitin-hydrolases and other protein
MTSTFSLKVHLPPEFGDVELIQSICDDRKQQFPTTATAAPANRVQIESTSGERHPSRMTAVPIVRCDYVQLSPTPSITFENSLSRLAAVFCPSALVDTALEQVQQKNQRLPDVAVSGHPSMYSKVEWVDSRKNLSQILLSLIHPFLSKNFTIQAILAFKHDNGVTNKSNNSGDIVIVNLSHCPYATIVDDLFDSTNCEVIHSGPEAILKILLLSNLEFLTFRDIAPMESLARETTAMIDSRTTNDTLIEVPTCAVCLHRIEPSRLGLPRPRSHHLCSKFCPPPNFSLGNNTAPSCPRQRLLQPWAPPDYCDACHVIWNYWRKCDILSATIKTLVSDNDSNVFCTYCGMQETLWVCLTCGFVGCGRYSNKHAAGHNNETHHPFCLELSTLRIWSYVHGEFVHRLDTLECPSSLQHLQHLPFIESGGEAASRIFVRSDASTATLATVAAHSASVRSDTNEEVTSKYAILSPPYSTHNTADSSIQILVDYNRIISSSFASVNEKTPKKATMIGEEYEVLLQSALEDQAQFYEGEITWLRATLTGSLF